jgi:hypothetical protein
MLALELAKLPFFQPAGRVALLFHRRVVAPFALGASQGYHFSRHTCRQFFYDTPFRMKHPGQSNPTVPGRFPL